MLRRHPFALLVPTLFALWLAACNSSGDTVDAVTLSCGDGTHEEEGSCLPDEDSAAGDSAATDSDSGCTESTWYIDYDDDGFGSERLTWTGCEAITGYVDNADDCDDTNALIHPGATEDCDGLDNDCNGESDLCGGEVAGTLADADAKLVGEDIYDRAGTGLAGVGDLNGDGLDDVMVGAFAAGTDEEGIAYLYFGAPSGTVSLATADVRISSTERINTVGQFLDGAGDVNGDGYADLIIGAPYTWVGSVYAGAAYIVYGPITADVDLKDAGATVSGTQDSEWTGAAVSGAGDVNGDGVGDVLIGAYGWDPGGVERAGAAFLMVGPLEGDISVRDATAAFRGEAYQDDAGAAVLGGYDLDGDGIDDVVVGAPNVEFTGRDAFDGGVYAWFGPVTGEHLLADADLTLSGNRNEAGGDLSAGDVDGDGAPDLVVGADGDDTLGAGAGAAYVTAGILTSGTLDAAGFKLMGSTDSDRAGASADFVGDNDGDGFGDVVVGAQGYNGSAENCGAAYLVRGPITGSMDLAAADVVLEGESYGDEGGFAVAGVGDVDGNGRADWMVGATGDDDGGGDAGAAYLFLGADPD